MTMKRWDGASFINLTVAKRWDGASWIDLTIAKRWDGASWVAIPLPGGGGGAFSISISPGAATGFHFEPGLGPVIVAVTTNSVTATPGGGTGPYTYSWSRVSGDSALVVDSPSSATTTWTANLGRNTVASAVWRVTVTDSLLDTSTADVSVSAEYANGI